MTVMTLSLSLLFIYVKFYLYLDSFCLLCKTICMPQVGPILYCIVLYCVVTNKSLRLVSKVQREQ